MLFDMQIYMPNQDSLAQPDIAFTPRQIKKWIKSLSMIDMESKSRETLSLVTSSNRRRYPAKQRFSCMELIQKQTETFLEHHRRYLACQTFPLSPNAYEIYCLQQDLNAEIAIAYKVIITQIVKGESKLDQKKILICLYRAVSHLQQQYIASLLMYQEVPSSIWHDICQLYRVTEHYGLHHTAISRQDSKGKTSIHSIFKHLCASTLISFNQLRQGEADKVNKFLEQHHTLIDISNRADDISGEYIYIANLATGKKPAYYIPREMPISTENRFIGYSELVSKLAESTKKFTQSTSYYLNSTEELDPELAGRLITMIGNPSQRHKKRIKSSQSVTAIMGLQSITELLDPKPKDPSDTTQDPLTTNSLSLLPIEETLYKHSTKSPDALPAEQTLNDIWNPFSSIGHGISTSPAPRITSFKNERIAPLLDSWQVDNFNASGICLHYTADGICKMRVGEIIAIRDENVDLETKQWRIGIIRWMQGLPNKEHKIGVELFGAECACITVHNRENSQDEHQGLLLKKISENNKVYSLILPSKTSLDSREITIKGANSQRTIMLGRTLESTSCFTHIEVLKIFSKSNSTQDH